MGGRKLTAVLAAVVLLLSGCQAGATAPEGIVVAHTAAPVNLDFTATSGAAIPQALMENVYESLVRIDDDGEIQPALAASWELSEDRRTYTFRLRPGVTFSNGEPLTAESVKFSYDRIAESWTNALGAQMAAVESTEAVDDLTVRITLATPSNRWLFTLASFVGAVFTPGGVDDLANTAVGTGPYTIDDYDRGRSLTFQARDDYWGANEPALAPRSERVTFRYYRDAVAATNALRFGDVDVIANLQAPEVAGEFERDSRFQVIEGTTTGEVLLSMNNAEGVFADRRAREAVMYGIDEAAVLETAWAGYGTLIGAMVPPTDPYFEDLSGQYPFDPERARELVGEAGIEGETLAFTVPNLPYALAIADIVVAQLADIGLDARIETQEFPAVWLDRTFTQRQFDLSVINHVEPRDILTVFSADYYVGYDDSRIAPIAAEADAGTEEEYVAGMQEVARIIADDAAADPLFLFPNLVVAAADIEGIRTNAPTDSYPIAPLARRG